MNTRRLRRYVDDLLAGRRPRGFRPDDDEADDIRTAIALRAARPGQRRAQRRVRHPACAVGWPMSSPPPPIRARRAAGRAADAWSS
jgi:hypothetical protein